MRAALIITLVLGSGGCGYRLQGGDSGGPVEALRLGGMEDLGATGHLADAAMAEVHRRLAGRSRPALGRGPILTGRIEPLAEGPAAFDATGAQALMRVALRAELRLQDGAREVWRAGPVIRHAVYAQGATPLITRDARRRAQQTAARHAINALIDQLLAEAP
jgi:hypothetical protein